MNDSDEPPREEISERMNDSDEPPREETSERRRVTLSCASAVAQCCSERRRDRVAHKVRAVQRGRSFTLDLSSRGVINLPASLTTLQSLQVLNLRDNRLQSLPWAVPNLPCLVELYLDQNQLTILPPTMAQLEQLTELHLSHNCLCEVPAVVCELPALKWLFLADNPLQQLTPALALLPSLSCLNVDGCPLTEPPAEVTALGFAAIKDYLKVELNRLMPSISSEHITNGSFPLLLAAKQGGARAAGDVDLEKDADASCSEEEQEGSGGGDCRTPTDASSSGGEDGGGGSGEGAHSARSDEENPRDRRTGRGRLGSSSATIDLQATADGACVVCFEEQRTHVLVPCGHFCLCAACSVSIMRRSMGCPVCRAPFELAMKVFS